MTTKLYLHDVANAQSGTYPTTQIAGPFSWNVTAADTLRRMDTSIGVLQTSRAGSSLANTVGQSGGMGQWVSAPLSGAQTVGGGTLTFNHANSESNLLMNLDGTVSVYVKVWRPSTGASVGDVVLGNLTGPVEPTVASSEQVTHGTVATSGISAADGDVIIVNFWQLHTQGMSTSYTGTIFYDGTTENTTENAVVSNHAAYVEFAENLVFQAASITAGEMTVAANAKGIDLPVRYRPKMAGY